MDEFDQTPDDLRGVEKRLRDEREEWSGHDLDQIKRRSMAQATSRAGWGKATRGMPMSRRILVVVLSVFAVGGVVTGGIAATSNGGHKDAAKDQYGGGPPETCPNGNPKPPGGNCGNGPPETCPNGNPKPPGGNCGRGPRDEAEDKCRDRVRSDRARNKAAKKRHREYMSRYHGAKRQRLARKFKHQERVSNARATRRYKQCHKRAQAQQA
jgi:hypothetical protein